MRTQILIILLFFSGAASAQDSLKTIISNDVCNCIDHLKKITEDSLSSCFQNAIQKSKEAFIVPGKSNYTDSSYYKASEKLRQEIFESVFLQMVQTCTSYFVFMDTLRHAQLKEFDKDSLKREINKISESDPKKWKKDFYTERGIMYFEMADMENALADFNNAIKSDPNAQESIYFKAWIFELKGNYEDSYKLYNQLAVLTNKSQYKIMAAVVKRKKDGL